jgi:ATP-dependent protease ClpP protease subunit
MAAMLSRHTGQPKEQVMKPEKAVAYGLVDRVLEQRVAA